MKNEELFDITEVCEMFNITSRTLRFYEGKGLIESTKAFSNRRRYSKQQLELIKKILVLRALDLPVSKIQSIQKGDSDLKQAIIERKAEIIAKSAAKAKEIRLLDDALNTISDGGDIFAESKKESTSYDRNRIVSLATEEFIKGDYQKIFERFTEKMQAYTPLTVLKRVVGDTLIPLGAFVSFEKTISDDEQKSIFYSYLRYEKLGLRIKFVLFGEKICGFWLSYYEV